MYFIHNKYDAESREQLETLAEGTEIVDFYSDYDKYSKLQHLSQLPCMLERLEYSQPEPTEQEQILTALAQQKEENLTIMMAQADAYEAEQANSLTIMLALADIYERGGVE